MTDTNALVAEIEAAINPDYGYCLVAHETLLSLIAKYRELEAALEDARKLLAQHDQKFSRMTKINTIVSAALNTEGKR